MVSLMGDSSEQLLLEQAHSLASSMQARLTVIHVNDPHAGEMSMMMDSPKKITAEILQAQIKEYGFANILDTLEIIIAEGASVPRTIVEHCKDIDLLIVGHRKMSEFKANIMDSVDEGITNLVSCPVLVVQKD